MRTGSNGDLSGSWARRGFGTSFALIIITANFSASAYGTLVEFSPFLPGQFGRFSLFWRFSFDRGSGQITSLRSQEREKNQLLYIKESITY